MSKKKAHQEDHVDETWLIPYADMLTLLLALFIVMFSMGQIDKEKLHALSQQFNIIFASGGGVLENEFNAIPPLEMLTNTNSFIEDEKMTKIKQTLQEEINKHGYADKVKVVLNREGLFVTMQDVVLFHSGEADVIKEVSPLLIKISDMLKGLENNIKVVGHTDNVPIHNRKFRSNWDLSAMRAVNVMNFMVDNGGLSPNKFSIQAYGEYMPKYDNSTEEGRRGNRRVEIFIERMYPFDENAASNKEEKKEDKKEEIKEN